MSHSRLSAFAVVFLLIISVCPLVAQNHDQKGLPDIAFTVSMPKPHTHMFEVEIHIKRSLSSTQPLSKPLPTEEMLVMPVWTPLMPGRSA